MATSRKPGQIFDRETKRRILSQISAGGGADVVRRFLYDITDELDSELRRAKRYALSNRWWVGPKKQRPGWNLTPRVFYWRSGKMMLSSKVLMVLKFKTRGSRKFTISKTAKSVTGVKREIKRTIASLSDDKLIKQARFSNSFTSPWKFSYSLESTVQNPADGARYGELQNQGFFNSKAGKNTLPTPWLTDSIDRININGI